MRKSRPTERAACPSASWCIGATLHPLPPTPAISDLSVSLTTFHVTKRITGWNMLEEPVWKGTEAPSPVQIARHAFGHTVRWRGSGAWGQSSHPEPTLSRLPLLPLALEVSDGRTRSVPDPRAANFCDKAARSSVPCGLLSPCLPAPRQGGCWLYTAQNLVSIRCVL